MNIKNLFFFFLLSLLFFSCKKKDTLWESNWVFPIINDTLSLDKYVNDSTLFINDAGYYELDLTRTIYNQTLTDLVKIPDTLIEEKFAITFLNLNLPPNYSFVNSTEEHHLDLGEAELKKVHLEQGTIDILIKNPLNVKTIFNLSLPGVRKDGVDFNASYEAPAGSIENPGIVMQSIDLSTYEMELTGTDGSKFNTLMSQVSVQTDPFGPETSMTNKDTTFFSAEFKNVKVNYARGYFGQQKFSDTLEIDVAPLSKISLGTIDLPSSSVTFSIKNGMKLDASAQLTFLHNQNLNTNNTIELAHPSIGNDLYISAATGTWDNLLESEKNIEFNSFNSNVEAMFENLGQKQKIGYSAMLNPQGNISAGWNEVFSTSRLNISFNAKMPLSMGMDGLTIVDTFAFSMNNDQSKTNVKSGAFELKYQNAFPFQAGIKLVLLDKNNNVINELLGTSKIKSGLMGVVSQETSLSSSKGESIFYLNEELLTKVDSIEKIIVQIEMNTPTTNSSVNEIVLVPADAFVKLLLKGNFKIENHLNKK